jgi:hypothetical protein
MEFLLMTFRRIFGAAAAAMALAGAGAGAQAAAVGSTSTAATQRAAMVAALSTMSSASGRIANVYVSQSFNLPFRIILDTPPAGCPGGLLYADEEYGNYQTYVSSLLFAYAQRLRVNVTYTAGNGGYCKIVEFGLQN